MSIRLNISSGVMWEDIIGYSRAVKIGNVIEVAGTTALDEAGNLVGPGDPYAQTRYIIAKIEKVLISAGVGSVTWGRPSSRSLSSAMMSLQSLMHSSQM